MKTLALAAFFTTAVSAGNLIEIRAVSNDAVEGSSEMTRTEGDRTETIHVMKPPIITTEDVAEVSDSPSGPLMKLSADGTKKFNAGIAGMEGKRIAFVIEGRLMMAPVITKTPLQGIFLLSGFKDAAGAKSFVEAFKEEANKASHGNPH